MGQRLRGEKPQGPFPQTYGCDVNIGAVQIAEARMRKCAVVEGAHVTRLAREGRCEVGDRVLEASEAQQRHAAEEVGIGAARVGSERLHVERDRRLVVTVLGLAAAPSHERVRLRDLRQLLHRRNNGLALEDVCGWGSGSSSGSSRARRGGTQATG